MRRAVLLSFLLCRWRTWGTEKLSSLPKATELVSRGGRIWTQEDRTAIRMCSRMRAHICSVYIYLVCVRVCALSVSLSACLSSCSNILCEWSLHSPFFLLSEFKSQLHHYLAAPPFSYLQSMNINSAHFCKPGFSAANNSTRLQLTQAKQRLWLANQVQKMAEARGNCRTRVNTAPIASRLWKPLSPSPPITWGLCC